MSKFKKIIIVLLILLAILIIVGIFIYNKTKQVNKIVEFTPEEEISEEQMRQTIVSLYFKSNNELVPEARLIDVKELLENPYKEILLMLIEGPKNGSLEKTIPEGTKINKIQKDGENLIIDLSEEFINNKDKGEVQEKLVINSIVKTLTELTEINGVKILINGEENKNFKDGIIKFNKIFIRDDL